MAGARALSLGGRRFPDDFIYLRLEVADLSSQRVSTYFDQALDFMDMYEP
jgi:predicted protein tyrosine phosphatase